MATLPPSWLAPTRAMDELWVPSEFCAAAFRRATRRPVVVVPHPVAAPPPGPPGFPGVPDDLFLFASIFEWSDRKNPDGLVRAFCDAFAGRRDVGLALKVGLRFSVARAAIERALTRLTRFRSPPVFVMVADESSPAVVRQLLRRADAYVSLHRAEGFGLCLAEAMVAGKPVVATGYSGNLEYMDADCAFLVEHRLVPVRQQLSRQDLFDACMHWAEPDHDAAVGALRACFFDGAERERRARAGRARVATQLAPARIGALMKQRLAL
jgi:glycosyltransferase involved in cell wall biosynthesis